MARNVWLGIVAGLLLAGAGCDVEAGKADVVPPETVSPDTVSPETVTPDTVSQDTLPADTAACTPDCTGRECGSNGCGGSCGTCLESQTCNSLKLRCIAKCQPDCAGKACGDDGCGGTCGSCLSGGVCEAGQCLPEPQDVIEPTDPGPRVDIMPVDLQFVDTALEDAVVDVCVSDCGTECIGVTPATNFQGACFQFREGLCTRHVECGTFASIGECISWFTEYYGDCDSTPAHALDAVSQANLKECLCELPLALCSALAEDGAEVTVHSCGKF